MRIGPDLEEILLRWEESRERGEEITVEELCRAHPEQIAEVRRLIRRLHNVNALIFKVGDNSTDAGPAPRRAVSLPGEVSNDSRYRAIRLQGSGGLGDVFLAFDEQLQREVVLKLIKRPSNPELSERFLREAAITARLGHPGIVPIFGLGHTADGQLCYAMRFVEGETLGAAIARFHRDEPGGDRHDRALAFRGLLTRLIAVCHAVAFAHSRGVIHRDLKPDNVMLGPYQETLVVDWGLAKRWREDKPGSEARATDRALPNVHSAPADGEDPTIVPEESPEAIDPDESLTRIGATLGTPAFMSPEQAEGLLDQVGPASDVYSLGATLFVLLTGRPAFRNRSQSELLEQVRRGDFLPPRQVNPATPPALEAICLKAMSLKPADRYAGASALAADLECWLGDEPVSAWGEPVLVRLGRWVRRHRPLVAGFAALAATALVALSLGIVLLGREQSKTSLALDDAWANYRLARTTMADVQTSFGLSAAERKAPNEAALWFAEAAETANLDPERALASRIRVRAWSLLGPTPIAALDDVFSQSLGIGWASIKQLEFDGRGRYLLAVAWNGVCMVHDIFQDERVLLPRGPRVVTSAAWGGAEHELLALADREGSVELIRVPEGEIVKTLRLAGGVSSLEFSRDGRLLALGGTSSRVWDVAKKTYVTPELSHPSPVLQLALNPQADRLAALAVDGRVWVYDIAAPGPTPLFEIPLNPAPDLALSKKTPFRVMFVDQGRAVLTFKHDRDLATWYNATTGAVVCRLRTGLVLIKDLLLSPNGRAITICGLGGVEFWDGKSGQYRGRFGDGSAEAAAFTRDGVWLLKSTAHYIAAPFRVPSGELGDWVLRHQDLPTRIAVSPDDSCFALSQADGLVRVWRFPEGGNGPLSPEAPTEAFRLAMSPDGRLVMPLGKYLTGGPSATHVHDLTARRAGPELKVVGILHGGAIAPDGRQVVTLSAPATAGNPVVPSSKPPLDFSRGRITIWDWERGVSVRDPIPTPSEPIAAAYRPDGRRVAVLCIGGECLWVNPADGHVLTHRRPEPSQFVPGPANEFLGFSPDGKLLVQWATGPPLLLDTATGLERSPALSPPPHGPGASVLDARFSPDSRYLATSNTDKTAQVWDLATGEPAAPPLPHPDWVFQSVFSADGSLLLTGGRDGNARVWDWRVQRLAGPPLLHKGEVQDVGFLNGDHWVVTKSSHEEVMKSRHNAVQIWDWRTGKALTPPRLLLSGWGSQLCLAPDGREAALGGNSARTVHRLELASWVDSEDPRFPADRLRVLTELSSGQRIEGGSTVVSLTSAEWMQRWRSYRKYTRDPRPPVSKRPFPAAPKPRP